ncbi:hypothetical protein OCF64_12995 [Bacillus wiedmannii]|uniref:hypothetical protein n=1 Tax=Bacillus wiedmannii TaxID=1890302 RepID=UPI0021CE1518|nr:hypothetical protein [Bacillus wiedmannii]MCU5682776.1 hypothetical protein [Bacillus wiedmannii]
MDLSDRIGLAFFTIILTFITNMIFKYLQNKFDFMVETKKFKRDYNFEQLKELYLELYAIIAQSEFLRYFHELQSQRTMKDIPFLETKRTKVKQKTNLFTGEILEVNEEIIETSISKFNKMGLVNSIINNKKYASQKLIKLAVAYRYCHEFYEKGDSINSEKFKEEELRLIYDIVLTIVSETNTKLKFCKMDYIKTEMNTGIMQSDVFNPQKNKK